MNVVLFGATGMIGSGVLQECLADARVSSVLAVGRQPCGVTHPKLRELVRTDFHRYDDIANDFRGSDACFFCLGVSAVGMDERRYEQLTFGLTIAAAEALAGASPGIVFCYVSGEGTDSTGRGRSMWARVKGRTENRLLQMQSITAYMFRPGYVQPGKGIRSKTAVYRAFYAIAGPLYPVLRRLAPTHVTTTANVGRAMIAVAGGGYAKRVLENTDINALAERHT